VREQSDAKFTRILVGYSVTEIILDSMAATARGVKAVSPGKARTVAWKETASRQVPAELQECLARRDLLEFLDQTKPRR
jgi:hypothetical protein